MSEGRMTDKLQRLIDRCKCSVNVEVNEHRNYYADAYEFLEKRGSVECPPEIDTEVWQRMIETDTIICCQFYPDTPIGSYDVYHYDLGKCLDECHAILDRCDGATDSTGPSGEEG